MIVPVPLIPVPIPTVPSGTDPNIYARIAAVIIGGAISPVHVIILIVEPIAIVPAWSMPSVVIIGVGNNRRHWTLPHGLYRE
jgi:hypothetical protein